MTTTIEAPSAEKRGKPHQWLGEPLPPLVQPPAKFAHLSGDALRQALISDNEIWTVSRVALEAGRSTRTVDKWLGNYVKYAAGKRRLDRNTIIKPTYIGTVAAWRAGAVRAWLMRTGKMRQDGTFVPYKPAGRPKGRTERTQRPKRGSDMNLAAPMLLTQYHKLIDGDDQTEPISAKAARAVLAEKHELSDRQVIRWLQRGRDLAAGRPGSR